ncbi:LuxR C-terminal-related transcriptional regulator [Kitasatospora sp. NPDC093102]|uniref:LuxR C-terminal-related transcriptional regulator n=1 Tax=Kitasatospora sp. NPDC093102 TaxID=3155069 RepID=UPI003432336D
MLNRLGLDREAEAVYRAMLIDPCGSMQELCAQVGLSESAVRSTLDRLADLRFLRPSRDLPGTLCPVNPERALDLILQKEEDEIELRRQQLELSRAAAARVVAEYASLLPDGSTASNATTERLDGLDAIQFKLETLARGVSDECLAVMPGGAQSQDSLDASRPLDEAAMRRGVSLLTLYQDSARNDPPTLAYARWMTESGGEVRTCPTLPPRMLLFDREIAVVPIDPANTRLGALCTRQAGIVAALVALFEQTWRSAVPLGADRSKDTRTGLSASERELLTLLAAGLTDEVAGRRLGISARSVRRQMAALMERLGASSRFEAGLKAAQHGWLD